MPTLSSNKRENMSEKQAKENIIFIESLLIENIAGN